MIDVTVPVPENRLPEFYTRFADFLGDGSSQEVSSPQPDKPIAPHVAGEAPAWVNEPGAKDVAAAFWRDVTDAGRDILRVLIDGALEDSTRRFTPQDLVDATGARTTQSVAGTLGGVGKVVSAHGLSFYEYTTGTKWHFVWEWDSKRRIYWMSVGMAQLLRGVGA